MPKDKCFRSIRIILCLMAIGAPKAIISQGTGDDQGQLQEEKPPRKVAIFMANRGGPELNDQLPIFEDMLTARISGEGFSVISRDVALSAVGDLSKRSNRNELDRALDDQTSALRLAQSLNADYLLLATVLGHDVSERHVNAYGISLVNENHILRTTYRVIDGGTGGSLVAGPAESTKVMQQSANSVTINSGIMRDLLNDASQKIASSILQKAEKGQIKDMKLSDSQIEFALVVGIADINFPEIITDENGSIQLTANQGTVQALAVTVELDGIVIGTTGTTVLPKFTVSPGMHRLRLTREDLVPWERYVNIKEGMQMNVSMQLNEAGLQRWRENTKIFNEMKKDAMLTAAEAERIKGQAQMLRQSGYRVDIAIDEKISVETDEGIKVETKQGLFNN